MRLIETHRTDALILVGQLLKLEKQRFVRSKAFHMWKAIFRKKI